MRSSRSIRAPDMRYFSQFCCRCRAPQHWAHHTQGAAISPVRQRTEVTISRQSPFFPRRCDTIVTLFASRQALGPMGLSPTDTAFDGRATGRDLRPPPVRRPRGGAGRRLAAVSDRESGRFRVKRRRSRGAAEHLRRPVQAPPGRRSPDWAMTSAIACSPRGAIRCTPATPSMPRSASISSMQMRIPSA